LEFYTVQELDTDHEELLLMDIIIQFKIKRMNHSNVNSFHFSLFSHLHENNIVKFQVIYIVRAKRTI